MNSVLAIAAAHKQTETSSHPVALYCNVSDGGYVACILTFDTPRDESEDVKMAELEAAQDEKQDAEAAAEAAEAVAEAAANAAQAASNLDLPMEGDTIEVKINFRKDFDGNFILNRDGNYTGGRFTKVKVTGVFDPIVHYFRQEAAGWTSWGDAFDFDKYARNDWVRYPRVPSGAGPSGAGPSEPPKKKRRGNGWGKKLTKKGGIKRERY